MNKSSNEWIGINHRSEMLGGISAIFDLDSYFDKDFQCKMRTLESHRLR
jgi:hypothetical protein